MPISRVQVTPSDVLPKAVQRTLSMFEEAAKTAPTIQQIFRQAAARHRQMLRQTFMAGYRANQPSVPDQEVRNVARRWVRTREAKAISVEARLIA